MTIDKLAERAVKDITEVLDLEPAAETAKKLDDIIQHAIIEAVLAERSRCASVATNVCSADQDMAHKLATEIRAGEVALIANLSSLR